MAEVGYNPSSSGAESSDTLGGNRGGSTRNGQQRPPADDFVRFSSPPLGGANKKSFPVTEAIPEEILGGH